jgi:2-iminobutanoate/2-iminopropanoate deaminase
MKDRSDAQVRAIEIAGLEAGGHYSPAIVANGFVFVSGQTPRDADRRIIGSTIETQTAAALDNVARILSAAGGSLANVVKVTIYLTDLALFPRFNTVYASYFPDIKPARTTVECGLREVLVEVDAIAFIGA